MSDLNSSYWNKDFSFSRDEIGERIAVEAYRLLWLYTSSHRNCRVGRYIEKLGERNRFYPFDELIRSDFEKFSREALSLPTEESRKLIYLKHGYESQLEQVVKLQCGLTFEFVPKTFLGGLLGYDFSNAFRVLFEPDDVLSVSGTSLHRFAIQFVNYDLDVSFSNQVAIVSASRSIYGDYEQL